MSYLLETLGRGLVSNLRTLFARQLPSQPDDTAELLGQRVGQSPASADLQMRLGLALLDDARVRQAQQHFQRARDLTPLAPQPLIGLACSHEILEEIQPAAEMLTQAGRLDPRDARLPLAEAACLERLGRTGEARLAYQRAARLCPTLRSAYERLAALAVLRGDWDDATGQYERIVDLSPDDLAALTTLGALHLQRGDYPRATVQFQHALFVEPELDSEPLARDAADDDGMRAAILQLEERLAEQPGVAPLHVQLGDLYVRSGDDARAIAAYQSALDTQPQFLEATVKLGTQHMRQGRSVEASATFLRAIELNDRLMLAFVGLGLSQLGDRRDREAYATLDLAVSLEPSTTLLFAEASRLALYPDSGGPSAMDTHDDDASLVLARHRVALQGEPNHVGLLYHTGLLLRHAGRTTDAAAHYRAATEIYASYAAAHLKLAACQRDDAGSAAGVDGFQAAFAVDPAVIDTHYRLPLMHLSASHMAYALDGYETPQGTSGSGDALRLNLPTMLHASGTIDTSTAMWAALQSLSVDASLMCQRERRLRTETRGKGRT